MNILLNIIWLIFGGFFISIVYCFASIALMITIIGFPFGRQTLKLATLVAWPFGTDIIEAKWPSGCLAGGMNVLWLYICGLEIAAFHLIFGAILCITVIGIPFGMQHFKLMKLALFPFGNSVS